MPRLSSTGKPWLVRGFTLVELLVVVAIIALLLSILLPSLSSSREQAKSVRCLANLRDLGSASHTYASSDASEVLVPTPHRKTTSGFGTPGAWFLGNTHFGGRGGNPHLLPDVNFARAFNAAGQLGPHARPLNRILFKHPSWLGYEEAKVQGDPFTPDDSRLLEHANLDMGIFHCPGDVGIPHNRGALSLDWGALYVILQLPGEQPLYELTGNSYSTHWGTPLITMNGSYPYWGYGAILRQASTFPNPARNILYRDGIARATEYYNRRTCCGQTAEMNLALRVPGWHGREMVFNATFADGHADQISHLVRTDYREDTIINTNGLELQHSGEWEIRGSRAEPVQLPMSVISADEPALIRGDGWAMDCFPAPMNIVIANSSELAPPFP